MSVLFPPYSGGGGGPAVESVQGMTGAVVLDAADVGALPDDAIAFTTTANRLYGTGSSGQPTVYVISSGTTTGSVAQRGTSGVLQVGTPTAAAHATTKQYVDDAIATAISDVVRSDGTVTDIVAVTQAEYDGLTPDATTHYLIDG
jgi:hypothetical protein